MVRTTFCSKFLKHTLYNNLNKFIKTEPTKTHNITHSKKILCHNVLIMLCMHHDTKTEYPPLKTFFAWITSNKTLRQHVYRLTVTDLAMTHKWVADLPMSVCVGGGSVWQHVAQEDVHESLWMCECVYVVRKMTSMCVGSGSVAEGNEWTRRASGWWVPPPGLRSNTRVCV